MIWLDKDHLLLSKVHELLGREGVDIRGDRSLVRIYARGELIKTHERKPSGGRSTDYTDYPDSRVPYARRWPNYFCQQARELGPAAGDFTAKLLSGEFPWSRLRQAQKLLRLAQRYGAARLPRLGIGQQQDGRPPTTRTMGRQCRPTAKWRVIPSTERRT